MRRRIWLYLGMVMTLIIIIFLIFNSFYTFYRVNGSSMAPTLQDGEIYRVNKRDLSIKRGDIIVFRSEKDNLTYIKRVIALPGEEVAIHNNHVYINGHMLLEPYIPDHPDIKDVKAITVPPAHFYVLGDDRVESYDSRHFGTVSQNSIIGTLQIER